MDTARIGRSRPRRQDEFAKLKRAFERFQRALSEASEPARKTFVEDCREEIMALANLLEPPNPEPPSPAEVEFATVPPRPQGHRESAKCPG
jgi:hypothetical protein